MSRSDLFAFAFTDQTDDQGDQEERETDDPRREPDGGTEGDELLERIVIPVIQLECAGIPGSDQPHRKDDDQQRADEDADRP